VPEQSGMRTSSTTVKSITFDPIPRLLPRRARNAGVRENSNGIRTARIRYRHWNRYIQSSLLTQKSRRLAEPHRRAALVMGLVKPAPVSARARSAAGDTPDVIFTA